MALFSKNNHAPLDDLMVFHQVARSLTSSLELANILETILDQMKSFIDAEMWALLMLDADKKELTYAHAGGRYGDGVRNLRVPVGKGVAGWVAEHGESLIIPESANDVRTAAPTSKAWMPVRSAVAVPIRGRRGTHGVIEIINPRQDQLNDYSISFLHILADYAAIAIENAHDVKRIHQLTITDDATGLFNVRYLYQVLEELIQNNKQSIKHNEKPLTRVGLAFIDLDRFKQVNDVHGHLIGSSLLNKIGQRLQELTRKNDLCFRYGGDEFVIVMPGADKATTLKATERIHQALTETVFSFSDGHNSGNLKLSIGASIGVASYPEDSDTLHGLIGVADASMYAVKSSGRGRVHAA